MSQAEFGHNGVSEIRFRDAVLTKYHRCTPGWENLLIWAHFDELGPVMGHGVSHGFHIDQSKQAARELHENAVPGIVDEDSDWSENGSLEAKDQLQQEY